MMEIICIFEFFSFYMMQIEFRVYRFVIEFLAVGEDDFVVVVVVDNDSVLCRLRVYIEDVVDLRVYLVRVEDIQLE